MSPTTIPNVDLESVLTRTNMNGEGEATSSRALQESRLPIGTSESRPPVSDKPANAIRPVTDPKPFACFVILHNAAFDTKK